MATRFNVDKYYSGHGLYNKMDREELAFHDALHRRICGYWNGNSISWSGHQKNICPQVGIDNNGKMTVSFRSRHKNERATVKLSDIQGCLEQLLEFLSVCYDFGYLIPGGGDYNDQT